jgi:hypothetical protein
VQLWTAAAFAPRPLYYAGAETPRLLFDGVDDSFTGTAVSFPDVFHLLVVLDIISPATNEVVFANSTATTSVYIKNDTTVTVTIAGVSQDFTVPSLASNGHLIEISRDVANTVTVWVNTVKVVSTYTMAGAVTFNRIATDGAQYYAGSLYAIAGWARTFTVLERRQVEGAILQAYIDIFDPDVITQFQASVYALCHDLVRARNVVPSRGLV